MFKFILARHKIHPKVNKYHTQWYLLLDTEENFKAFLNQRAKDLIRSYMNMKKNMKVINAVKSGHLSNRDESTIYQLLTLKEDRKTIVDDCEVLDGLLKGYIYIFAREGKIVISPNNSCRHIDNTFQILDTKEREGIIFPATSEKDISVKQWPNGHHWYVRIGNYDLPNKYANYEDGFEAGKTILYNGKK